MIKSTYLTARQQAGLEPVKTERVRPKREVVPEYILLVTMVALACVVNFLNWRADAQDRARMFAARHTNNNAPKPPYIISTPMRKEVIYINGIKITRQWYFNDDASMRYVDAVPPENAAKIGYLKNDVVFSHDRRRKVWQRTEVAKGDNGRAAAYIAYDFEYASDNTFTMTVVSATPGGWEWTHHFDAYRDDQLVKQVLYDRFGGSTQKLFAVEPQPRPVELPNEGSPDGGEGPPEPVRSAAATAPRAEGPTRSPRATQDGRSPTR